MNKQEMKEIMAELAFVWADALPITEIARILSISPSEALSLAQDLAREFDEKNVGLTVKIYDKTIQLVTRPEHYSYLSMLFEGKKSSRLSNSSLETLAIIAYKQPITRVEIDEIRGVTSSSALSTLLKRGLIEEWGRLDQAGRPILYKTTVGFLQAFDLPSLEDLPSVEQIKEALAQALEEKNED